MLKSGNRPLIQCYVFHLCVLQRECNVEVHSGYLYIIIPHFFLIYRSFDADNRFTQADDGPIANNTVLALDPQTGKLLHQWGTKV